MKIMHYFLGFPPYRSGGLTKFAFDLMKTQVQAGHNVVALWPGEMGFIIKKTSIKKTKPVMGIEGFKLINPLPVPLDEGIAKPDYFRRPCDKKIFKEFLMETKPDVIHIHTLMGLYIELLQAAKELGIRTVFTTHDYFGICNKVYMYNCGACENFEKCTTCNETGLTINKIRIMQSSVYRLFKNFPLVKLLRKKHRTQYFSDAQNTITTLNKPDEEYGKLRDYYSNMFALIEIFHFNSSVSEMIYNKYIPNITGKVITISHRDIRDRRKKKNFDKKHVRMTYLSPAKPYKGYELLKSVLDELYKEGYKNFSLNIYSHVSSSSRYMNVVSDGYDYSELEEIFNNTDVLIAPSIWYETFGYTVLEAISYGVPVIVSDRVGAKDIIGDGGAIVSVDGETALKELIRRLDAETLSKWNENIVDHIDVKDWMQFTYELEKLYLAER